MTAKTKASGVSKGCVPLTIEKATRFTSAKIGRERIQFKLPQSMNAELISARFYISVVQICAMKVYVAAPANKQGRIMQLFVR